MNKSRMISVVLFMTFLISTNVALSQTTVENVDPTVAQFPVVRGDGDPSYNGALDFISKDNTICCLSGLNDTDFSFDQIADLIENGRVRKL